eukprot:1217864-Pyramimonas_sp.AAC.1
MLCEMRPHLIPQGSDVGIGDGEALGGVLKILELLLRQNWRLAADLRRAGFATGRNMSSRSRGGTVASGARRCCSRSPSSRALGHRQPRRPSLRLG